MSITAINWAMDKASEESMSHPARIVFFCLAHCHNQNTGWCFPSAEKLSKLAGYSIRAVRSAIKELCELGLIKIFRRKRMVDGQWRQCSNSVTFTSKSIKKPTKSEESEPDFQGANHDISRVHSLHPNIEDSPTVKSEEKPAPSKPYDLAVVVEDSADENPEPVEPSHPEISFDEFVRRVAPPIHVYERPEVQNSLPSWMVNSETSVADRYLRKSLDRFADKSYLGRAA